MPKVKLNSLIEGFSGRIGNLVLYNADGQSLARRAPEATPERTEKQAANSSRFKSAGIEYARRAMADPALKAAYRAVCVGHQNAWNLAIRDALTKPVIHEVELSGYTGKPGQALRVNATDDFKVKEVRLEIRDPQGNLVEDGAADWDEAAKAWVYSARVDVPSGQTVSVKAVARDHPGNTAEVQRWHYLA